MTKSTIHQDQNTEPFLRLLRARSQLYLEATWWQWSQFTLSVVLPFCLGIMGILSEEIRPYAAAITLIITVADATYIDRTFRQMLATAARVCEQFDCDLYGLPWKVLVAGKKIDPEEISRASKGWRNGDSKLTEWYPSAVGRAPIALARFVCQRANLWYDSSLRRGYAKWLFRGAWFALAALIVVALVERLDLLNFIVSVVPATPLLIWAMREGLRQRDAAAANDVLKAEVESAIESYISGKLSDPQSLARARDIQDGIYQRRASTGPLLLARVYHWRRAGMEHQMNEGADQLLQRAGY